MSEQNKPKSNIKGDLTQRAYYRFLGFVNKTERCWFWQGYLVKGYGQFGFGGERHFAHRFSYIIFKGPVPEGLSVDHLCRNKSCVNPDHLEAVTTRENLLRSPWTLNSIQANKTHCINGHIFDVNNTYTTPKRKRGCRQCAKERAQKCRDKKKLLLSA